MSAPEPEEEGCVLPLPRAPAEQTSREEPGAWGPEAEASGAGDSNSRSDSRAATSARSGVPLAWALVALAMAFLAALACGSQQRRGLGFLVDEAFLDGVEIGGETLRAGAVILRATLFDARGNQVEVFGRASLGTELVVSAIYLALGLAAGVALWRRRPELGKLRGGLLSLKTLGVLVPLLVFIVTVGLVGGATWLPGRTTSGLLNLSQPMLVTLPCALLFGFRFVLVGPVAEELLWRGVIYGGLRARLRAVPAAVVCSMGFVSWHLVVGWRALPALLLHYSFSLLACRLTEVSRSLWPAIALHVLGNGCALAIYALVTARPNEVLYVLGLPR